ncbi:MAG: electron transfer flavoprotein subunit beta/FixA family protein [Cyanobacteria bacterium HKST-UBA06]|nr:electron transfer flavoprotein subunit beta/FixA family protein [Cyanobacteria bacterium HKST-UBA05]MCA9798575.1 electron transfer flavoprotein subunit beta/FixA family protein [Cyanobacteria bacterium HKST-UBA04]MCA9807175.1 electron transfer flavoprotein subunit beta/FixA family protein [Cyanobacteria bacterium HKST-UBA06]
MNIVVCIKTVPDTAQLRFDSNNQLMHDNLEWVMNPFCEYALETAVRLKEAIGESATVTVLTVGDARSKDALKKALAVGCDQAYLINDDRFNGGDTVTLCHILNAAIAKYVPDAKLVLFGQYSSDQMSGNVGPGVGQLMEIPSLTFCKEVTLSGEQATLKRETEKGIETYTMTLPGVVCMMKCDYELRMPAIKGVMKANRTEIPEVKLDDLGLSADQVGAGGAFVTSMSFTRKPQKTGGQKIDGSDPQAAVNQLIDYLHQQQIV